jgi:dihydrodipicolinate synthase/N-acetylneuraminate lyase
MGGAAGGLLLLYAYGLWGHWWLGAAGLALGGVGLLSFAMAAKDREITQLVRSFPAGTRQQEREELVTRVREVIQVEVSHQLMTLERPIPSIDYAKVAEVVVDEVVEPT